MRESGLKKLYYSISEVSKITEVEQYVLRYWEGEFELLKPQKNRSGNRAYSNQDIKLIFVIKLLLREKKFTIEGAKIILAEKSLEELISDHIDTPNKSVTQETIGKATVEKKKEDIIIKREDLSNILGILISIYKKL